MFTSNDPKSALRRSSIRVVTRKCQVGRGRKSRGRKEGRREEKTAEWRKTDDQMSWKRKKTNVHFFVWCFIFSLVHLLLGVRVEKRVGSGWCGGGQRSSCFCVGQLSAAVWRRLPLSMHGGALVFHAVQVLLLRDGQHRGQDLIVLPVRQTWNTCTQATSETASSGTAKTQKS